MSLKITNFLRKNSQKGLRIDTSGTGTAKSTTKLASSKIRSASSHNLGPNHPTSPVKNAGSIRVSELAQKSASTRAERPETIIVGEDWKDDDVDFKSLTLNPLMKRTLFDALEASNIYRYRLLSRYLSL